MAEAKINLSPEGTSATVNLTGIPKGICDKCVLNESPVKSPGLGNIRCISTDGNFRLSSQQVATIEQWRAALNQSTACKPSLSIIDIRN